jgi:hypothetical protein
MAPPEIRGSAVGAVYARISSMTTMASFELHDHDDAHWLLPFGVALFVTIIAVLLILLYPRALG